jgi:leader peptidase (prepilin peptidase)/N-methyltransferase
MSSLPLVLLQSATGAAFGAIAGSFLNVVIHRVPRLIDSHDGPIPVMAYVSGLAWPPSHCPGCNHPLAWRDNVPILSYFALGGCCRFCRQSYGWRYLAVELAGAAAFAYCVAILGFSAQGFLAALFLGGLIALIAIDIEEHLLPDAVLAPLFCLGLAFQGLYGGGLLDAGLGAAAGYGVLRLIAESYRLYSGTDGMGYGDVKFAGAIGTWIGVAAMPAMFAIAFISGVAVTLPLALSGRLASRAAIPFGPFLAFGGFCAFAIPGLPPAMMRLFLPV